MRNFFDWRYGWYTFLFMVVMVAQVQAQSTPPPPTTDPQAEIDRLSTQVTELESLATQVANNQALVERAAEINALVDLSGIWIAAFVVGVVGIFVGSVSLFDVRVLWQRRINKMLTKALYQVDPLELTVWVPAGGKFARHDKVLRAAGFKKIIRYTDYPSLGKKLNKRYGVILVDLAERQTDGKYIFSPSTYTALIELVDSNRFDPDRQALILYTTGGVRVEEKHTDELQEKYDTHFAMANMPITLPQAVLNCARVLNPSFT